MLKLKMQITFRFTVVFAVAFISLLGSFAVRAETRSIEDDVFACAVNSECIYFDDFRKSKAIRTGLAAAIKKSGVKVSSAVYAFVSP